MQRTWTVEDCLARACRLMLLADRADSYEQVLTYDGLAREWLELAARTSRSHSDTPPASTVALRRFTWREFRSWFR